jgi:hypothetical protein
MLTEAIAEGPRQSLSTAHTSDFRFARAYGSSVSRFKMRRHVTTSIKRDGRLLYRFVLLSAESVSPSLGWPWLADGAT